MPDLSSGDFKKLWSGSVFQVELTHLLMSQRCLLQGSGSSLPLLPGGAVKQQGRTKGTTGFPVLKENIIQKSEQTPPGGGVCSGAIRFGRVNAPEGVTCRNAYNWRSSILECGRARRSEKCYQLPVCRNHPIGRHERVHHAWRTETITEVD